MNDEITNIIRVCLDVLFISGLTYFYIWLAKKMVKDNKERIELMEKGMEMSKHTLAGVPIEKVGITHNDIRKNGKTYRVATAFIKDNFEVLGNIYYEDGIIISEKKFNKKTS